METRIQIVAVLVTGGLFIFVLELVRRRHLMERYALLWLFSAAILLVLAAWKGLLERMSSTIGIVYAPSALFVIAFGFVLVLLLHFSLVISRLSDQNKVLAQRLGLLERKLTEAMEAGDRAEQTGARELAGVGATADAERTR